MILIKYIVLNLELEEEKIILMESVFERSDEFGS
jgi:hypothetical protein